jgi:hypothetical protein
MFQRPYSFTRRNHLVTAEDIDEVGVNDVRPDTGWRTMTVGSVTWALRRVGNEVSFDILALGANWPDLQDSLYSCQVGPGFGPDTGPLTGMVSFAAACGESDMLPVTLYFYDDLPGIVALDFLSDEPEGLAGTSTMLMGTAQWRTLDDWPTVLPGDPS